MFRTSEAAASVVVAPSSVYPHRRSEPGALGVTPTGIEKLPAASGTSRWLRITIDPPVLFASCAPTQRSAGQVDVTEVGIASRLNQYGKASSSRSIVPVAWRISGFPTTGVEGADRSSVNPDANAGLAGAARAMRPTTAAVVHIRLISGGEGTPTP